MKKTMSPAQLEANRRNAQKSIGPKTPKGQAIFKMNACQHGILSQETVVRGRCIKEDDQEFAALHQRPCYADVRTPFPASPSINPFPQAHPVKMKMLPVVATLLPKMLPL